MYVMVNGNKIRPSDIVKEQFTQKGSSFDIRMILALIVLVIVIVIVVHRFSQKETQ